MFISINMAFFLKKNVNLEAVACIDAILCSFAFFLFKLLVFCNEKKKLVYLYVIISA